MRVQRGIAYLTADMAIKSVIDRNDIDALHGHIREGLGGIAGDAISELSPISLSKLLPSIQVLIASGLYAGGVNPMDFHKLPYNSKNERVIDWNTWEGDDYFAKDFELAKWMGNKLGGSIIAPSIKERDIDWENAGRLEKALGIPVIGSGLGRITRVSDKGLDEFD
jgi:hypothetical protein